MSIQLRDLFTVPNLICYFRILLIPGFVLRYNAAQQGRDFLIAALIVVLSGISDLLDGWIARRFHMVTDLGKLLDPVADKLTQAAIMLCLIRRFPSMLFVGTLFLIKELSMMLLTLGLFQFGSRLDGAKWFGKVATAVFYFCSIFLIALPAMHKQVSASLLGLTAAVLLLSFALYTLEFLRMWHAVQSRRLAEERAAGAPACPPKQEPHD